MSLALQIDPTPPHRLTRALEGTDHELVLLRARVLRMQEALCAPVGGASLDAAVVRELQGLDLIAQRLDALSLFVRALNHRLPLDPAVDLGDVLDDLPLADLAARLGASLSGDPATNFKDADIDTDAGDFDLF